MRGQTWECGGAKAPWSNSCPGNNAPSGTLRRFIPGSPQAPPGMARVAHSGDHSRLALAFVLPRSLSSIPGALTPGSSHSYTPCWSALLPGPAFGGGDRDREVPQEGVLELVVKIRHCPVLMPNRLVTAAGDPSQHGQTVEKRPTIKISLEGSKVGRPSHILSRSPGGTGEAWWPVAAAERVPTPPNTDCVLPARPKRHHLHYWVHSHGGFKALCFTREAEQRPCAIWPQGCRGSAARYHAVCRVCGRSDIAEDITLTHHVEETTPLGSDSRKREGRRAPRDPRASGGGR